MSNKRQKISITSVNTQGHKSDILTQERQRLETMKTPAFSAIQESGAPPSAWNLQQSPSDPQLFSGQISGFGKSTRRTPVFAAMQVPQGRKNPKPSRNSQIILSNRPIKSLRQIKAGKMGPGLRPPMMVETDDLFLASIHAPSGKPNFAGSQISRQFKKMQSIAKKRKMRAALVGDMNASPSILRKSIKKYGVKGATLRAPSGATHQSGSSLDSGLFTTNTVKVGQTNAMAGDHTMQTFTIDPE